MIPLLRQFMGPPKSGLTINPKILYTKISDKMAHANSADPDQIGSQGAVWLRSTLFAIPLSILINTGIKSKI